jgi:5-methylcytosine-specific restriction endonuclease McrA
MPKLPVVILDPGFKVCIGPCGLRLPLEAFQQDSKLSQGVRSKCKKCKSKEQKDRRAGRSPDEIAESRVYYQKKHIDRTAQRAAIVASGGIDEFRIKRTAYEANWKRENKEQYDTVCAAWREKNRETIREKVKIYNQGYNQRPYVRDKNRAWKLNNKNKIDAQAATYRSRRMGAIGEITDADVSRLHVWQDHCCYWCSIDLKHKHAVDHVFPLIKGGTNLPDNVVLACQKCNNEKWAHVVGKGWSPPLDHVVKRIYAARSETEIVKALHEEGLTAKREGEYVVVGDIRILVLSSFWVSERTGVRPPAPANPNTLVIYDFEWWEDPETVLGAILFGEPMPAIDPGYVGPDGYTLGLDIESPEAQGLFFIEGLPERVMVFNVTQSLMAA